MLKLKPLVVGSALLGFAMAGLFACPTPKCTSSSCPEGCCDPVQGCLLATETQCGFAGSQCLSCNAGDVCIEGVCSAKGPGTPTGPCAHCGTNACCTALGTCLKGDSNQNCGRGTLCQTCQTGFECTNFACRDPNVVKVGDPCAQDSDCQLLGGRYRCKLTTSSGNGTYSSGYCTQSCDDAGTCPSEGVCVRDAQLLGEGDEVCWRRCGQPTDCRSPGYACYPLGATSACWIFPLPEPDAGPPAPPGLIGKACSQDSECGPPPNDGYCERATLPDGGPSGYVGGECGARCDIDGDAHCGDGGICLAVGAATGLPRYFCQRACTGPKMGQGTENDGGCRTGYVCEGIDPGDGGVAAVGFCRPNCNNAGGSCIPGRICNGLGYCL